MIGCNPKASENGVACSAFSHFLSHTPKAKDMNIYVGNLAYSVTEDELRDAFEEYGKVISVDLIQDKYTGRSKGFGFVEMESDQEANAAIENLNDYSLSGRPIRVNETRPKEERPERPRAPRGGGGGRGGDRGGDRGGRSNDRYDRY